MQTTLDSAVTLPVAAAAEGAACADDPDAQAGFTAFTQTNAGRRIGLSHLQLSGLWCAGCATTIEHALHAEPGVLEARVSFGSQRASVRWDPMLTKVSALLAAIARAGYGAVPDAAAPARAMRQAEQRRCCGVCSWPSSA